MDANEVGQFVVLVLLILALLFVVGFNILGVIMRVAG